MDALIIFIKNPELGKVKTRLAATIGDQNALKVYHFLSNHAKEVALELNADRFLFYSSFIDDSDIWDKEYFIKKLQDPSPDLGQKMFTAFSHLKDQGYQKVMIMGSDCYDINVDILKEGFGQIDSHEVVLGPAFDGGYYAIGFNFNLLAEKDLLSDVFLNKTWSHDQVANEAISAIAKHGFSLHQLPTLSDVDVEADIESFRKKIF